MRSYSLWGSFEQPLHHASLVVFQQGEVEAVLVWAAAAAPAFLYRLHLHQRAMGVVEYHKTLRPARDKEENACCIMLCCISHLPSMWQQWHAWNLLLSSSLILFKTPLLAAFEEVWSHFDSDDTMLKSHNCFCGQCPRLQTFTGGEIFSAQFPRRLAAISVVQPQYEALNSEMSPQSTATLP